MYSKSYNFNNAGTKTCFCENGFESDKKKEFVVSLGELFELKRILMFELFFQENITKEINFINHLFSEA